MHSPAFRPVGDIATVVQHATAIRTTLSEAAEASDDIGSLAAEIDAFTHALRSARTTLDARADLPPSARNGVGYALRVCLDDLKRVEHEMSVCEKQVARKHRAATWRNYWVAAAWWNVGGRAEVEALKQRLIDQTAAIQTILACVQSSPCASPRTSGESV